MEWPPASVTTMTFDAANGFYEIELADGRSIRQPTGPGTPLPQDFRRVTYHCAEQTMTLVPPAGDPLVVDVFNRDSQATRRAGRPVIYLDQNQWIQLSRAVHAPHLLSDDNRKAAERLIAMANSEEVILPLSSGHMLETAQVDGNWRQRLAPVMVALSRGWIMRDPLVIRAEELQSVFDRRQGRTERTIDDVFTLDLTHLFAEPGSDQKLRHPDLDAPAFEQFPVLLAAVTAVYAMLIEDDRLHSTEGTQKAAAWADRHQGLAQELQTRRLSDREFRQTTLAMYLNDLQLEIATCADGSGMSLDDFHDWILRLADDDLARLPYIGRNREVIHLRLRNATDRWKGNDLIDMTFLPCAAAYADYLVAERKTIDYLRRAERGRTGGAVMSSSLTELSRQLD